MLVDSHCHLDRLDLDAYDGELAGALDSAAQQGVTALLCVGINLELLPAMLSLVEKQRRIFASVGVHPNEQKGIDPTVADLVAFASHPSVVAIGETGLDYFRSQGNLEWQRERFRTHIAAAHKLNRPLIIHSRDANEDTHAIINASGLPEAGGVMHCYTYDWVAAQKYLDLGLYISLSGIVTFANADSLREVAKKLPLNRMLVETDAPYLTPAPHRGKSNQPAYVRYVAEAIAELRGIELDQVAAATTSNFKQLFQVDL